MQVCHAREQYFRWLLVTKDLSPHTIRAYESDIAAFERHLGVRALVNQIDRDPLLAFMEEAAIASSRRDMHGNVDWKRRRVGWDEMCGIYGRQQHQSPGT
jgi:site-specific recombinase XerD